MQSRVRRAPRLPDPHAWVDAAPFAAHLRRLAEATGFPATWLAVHADVTVTLAEHLVEGRDGRRLRRLPRHLAARLLRLDAAGIARAARSQVAAGPTAQRLAALRGRGRDLTPLADALGITPSLLGVVADGDALFVPAPWAWASAAALALADRHASALTSAA